jgi:hypothetical protein
VGQPFNGPGPDLLRAVARCRRWRRQPYAWALPGGKRRRRRPSGLDSRRRPCCGHSDRSVARSAPARSASRGSSSKLTGMPTRRASRWTGRAPFISPMRKVLPARSSDTTFVTAARTMAGRRLRNRGRFRGRKLSRSRKGRCSGVPADMVPIGRSCPRRRRSDERPRRHHADHLADSVLTRRSQAARDVAQHA